MTPNTILLIIELIDLAAIAVSKGPAVIAAFERNRDAIRAMVAEGRDPTADEIAALRAEIADLRTRLHDDN
jgi:chloramphenicol 3-O-phosphotransferase